MFIGHYAVALAAKRAAPRTSLGTLFAAASLADLLWVVFLLAGWGAGDDRRGPGTLPHDLDFVTHRPDMQLWPGGARLGLGLYRSVTATVAVEAVMFAAGAWVYATATRARDGAGRWAAWADR